jgi:hypothetical protein
LKDQGESSRYCNNFPDLELPDAEQKAHDHFLNMFLTYINLQHKLFLINGAVQNLLYTMTLNTIFCRYDAVHQVVLMCNLNYNERAEVQTRWNLYRLVQLRSNP